MIGSKYITIDWKNWVQGMTSSNYTEDGGFALGTGGSSPSTTCVNPLITPGLLNFPASPVDKSTNLSGSIIASCDDASGTYNQLFVTDSGKFYGWNGTTLSSALATDATRQYTAGKTDMAPYSSYAYGTSNTYVWEWVVTTATINQTYFAFPSSSGSASWAPGSCPHPVLVYEGNIYYANGPQLLRQTAPGGTPTEILLLQNFGEVIIALGIDPGSGKMVISTSSGINASGTLPKTNRVLYYDGFSNKVIKVVPTDSIITCFFNLMGTLFIGYGQNWGYWTGTGIQFLRKLNVGLDGQELIYKHKVTNIGHILYIAEKQRVLAFGEIMQGKGRSWWYIYQNFPSGVSTNLSFVANIGSNKLGFSYATSQFFSLDVSSSSDIYSNSLVYSFKYEFPRPVTFNSLVLDYAGLLPQNTDMGTVYLYTDDDQSQLIATVNTTRADVSSFTCPWPTTTTRSIQIRYLASRNLPAIERWTITYNDKE